MKRLFIIGILLVLVLSACQGATTPSEVMPAESETTHGEDEMAADAEMPAEEASTGDEMPAEDELPAEEAAMPADEQSLSAGTVTYQIVAEESTLSYEVDETFINQNNKLATAIGVTPQISGEVQIDFETPANSTLGTFTADISQFKSDSSRRDGVIRDRFLESGTYPLVTFVPTQISGFPENPAEGQEITFKVSGDTTIRETTLPLIFDITAMLEDDILSGTATTMFLMSDFGFGPISIAGILETEDEVKITFDFIARP
jgi:polyisoprenoid-binding protein YceI